MISDQILSYLPAFNTLLLYYYYNIYYIIKWIKIITIIQIIHKSHISINFQSIIFIIHINNYNLLLLILNYNNLLIHNYHLKKSLLKLKLFQIEEIYCLILLERLYPLSTQILWQKILFPFFSQIKVMLRYSNSMNILGNWRLILKNISVKTICIDSGLEKVDRLVWNCPNI